MSAADLHAEFREAALTVGQAHLDRLAALGVGWSIVDDLHDGFPPFGIGKAFPVRGGRYVPRPGLDHVIMPVWGDGELIDLVAWRSDAPGNWHLRTGAGYVLGDLDRAIDAALWGEGPAVLRSDPLGWLRAGGNGLCVLNWGSSQLAELLRLPAIIAPDRDIAGALRSALTRALSLTVITVDEGARCAA